MTSPCMLAHRRRAPTLSGYPEPAVLGIKRPAAIMESDPAPGVFLRADVPIPAPLVGIDPLAARVGPPVGRLVIVDPHLAPARMAAPGTVGRQRRAEFRGDRISVLRQSGGVRGKT